jgi:alpha-tubulin suppressor-like RCC1 family protein
MRLALTLLFTTLLTSGCDLVLDLSKYHAETDGMVPTIDGGDRDGRGGDAMQTDSARPDAPVVDGVVPSDGGGDGGPPSTPTLLAAGERHTCAEHPTNGRVYCWGSNEFGQFGDGTTSLPVIRPTTPVTEPAEAAHRVWTAMVAAGNSTWFLSEVGGLGYFGLTIAPAVFPDSGTPVVPRGTTTAVCVGFTVGCFTQGSSTYCWGTEETQGELGRAASGGSAPFAPMLVDGSVGFAALACNWTNGCGVDGGRVSCWGRGAAGTVGNGTTLTQFAPTLLADFGTVTQVAVGHEIAFARTTGGDVYAWGEDNNNELGLGTAGLVLMPTQVPLPAGATALEVVSGYSSACALLDDGRVICWGRNDDGEVPGAASPAAGPTEVDVGGHATDIAMSHRHACARLETGDVVCWGQNTFTQCGVAASSAAPPTMIDWSMAEAP